MTTLASEIAKGYGDNDPDRVFAIPYDADMLRREFTEVYTVERAFDLDVAAVWRRTTPHQVENGAESGAGFKKSRNSNHRR